MLETSWTFSNYQSLSELRNSETAMIASFGYAYLMYKHVNIFLFFYISLVKKYLSSRRESREKRYCSEMTENGKIILDFIDGCVPGWSTVIGRRC